MDQGTEMGSDVGTGIKVLNIGWSTEIKCKLGIKEQFTVSSTITDCVAYLLL